MRCESIQSRNDVIACRILTERAANEIKIIYALFIEKLLKYLEFEFCCIYF
jgi:hypothetical protein